METSEVTTANIIPSKPRFDYGIGPFIGCDPEIFLEAEDGHIVGSERVIPEKGVIAPGAYHVTRSQLIQDGVQVELNPSAQTCRANVANEIAIIFRHLRKMLAGQKLKVSFRSVVEVDRKELDSLSEKSRTLGCAPSLNIYDSKATISVPKDFAGRSAGGHIHLGLDKSSLEPAGRLVQLLDLGLGNTFVLLERDPLVTERRKVYGRAGEHRLPKHGLEYRVLSNFWLRSYPLTSLAWGLARQIVALHLMKKGEYAKELLKQTDPAAVMKAINENDLGLAWKNFEVFAAFMEKFNFGSGSGYLSLPSSRMPAFRHFARMIQEKGIEYWFPKDPMTYWCDEYTEGHDKGWEWYCDTTVTPDLRKWQLDQVKE